MHSWFGSYNLRSGARHRAVRIGLAATLTATGVALAPVVALPASAATSVTAVTAGVNPTTAGAGTATYTIHFTTSSTGSLVGGDQITLTAPDGTALPSAASGYTINATAGSVPVGSVTTSQVVGPGSTAASNTFNQAVITIGGPNTSTPISNNDPVTVVVHPTGNPIAASTTDRLNVSTTADATPAQSATYTITPGPAAAFVSPQGDFQSTPTNSAFATPLGVTVTDAYGNPVSGALVTFTAPASTVAAPVASGTFDHVNSTNCSSTQPSNPPPSNVCVATSDSTGKGVASTFTADNTAGSFTVTATSPGVPTYTFHLTNCSGACPTPPTAVVPGTVSVSPATAGATGAAYAISFTTKSAVPGATGTIKFVAPAGTGFSANAGDYAVSVNNGHLATVSGVTASAASGSTTANQVVISLLLSTIGSGDLVTVHVTKSTGGTGVTNPTKAGFNYQIQESTSADAQPGEFTSTYAILPANPAAVSVAGGDNQTALIGKPFADPLVALVKDRFGNPVGGAQVTFTTPSSGPSAVWTNGTAVETDTTSSNGQAETSIPVANRTAGGPYPVTAAANADFNATAATFHLTNTAQAVDPSVPDLTSSTAGAQNVGYTLAFITSSTGGLGAGGTITFTAPSGTDFTSSNASDYPITVSGSDTATVDHVTTSAATGSTSANQLVMTLKSASIAPGDTVTVNISGVTNPTVASDADTITESTSSDSVPATTPDYSITPAAPSVITVVSGSGQSAQIGQQFAEPLVAKVQDAFGNPVPGEEVTFTAPDSGASATFAGNSTSEIDLTDANGIATSSVPTANGTGGTYTVSAADATFGLNATPAFTLTNSSAAWSGWLAQTSPPPGLATGSNPAVAAWQPGRLDLFVEGGDANLWHRWSTDGGSTWSGWESLGGVLAAGPAAVSWAPNRIDTFVKGSDGQLWHKWWDGSAWSGWEPLGGVLASAPAVSSWGAGRLDVFARGADGAIWHKWWDGSRWNAWESRGGGAQFAPAAVSWGTGHIDLFTVGTDGEMWHQAYDSGAWTGWYQDFNNLTFSSGPAVSTWGPGELDLFAASSSPGHALIDAIFDGTWQAESLGGQLASAPGAVSWGPQRIDAFVQGTDGHLWYQWYGSPQS